MKKQKLSIISTILGVLLICGMASCTDVGMFMPKGPKGEDGLAAYEFWKEQVINGTVNWPKNEVTEADYFMFLKGKDGKDGQSAYEIWKEFISSGIVPNPHKPNEIWNPSDNTPVHFWKFLTGASGEDGKIPVIGANGNWWIDGVDTGKPAHGADGKDGKEADPPQMIIGKNGNWWINGVDTGVPANGKDGKDGKVSIPTIGENGNWFIGNQDTGKPARGKDGIAPPPTIGTNGNWYINGEDTGVPAFGKDGKNGQSAYDFWKEEASKGTLPHPHKPGEMWDKDKVSPADFWEYLRGADGKDGKTAYELWKEAILNGTITDWSKNEVTESDFFKYLQGKDGKDGKTAYELWKEYIAGGNVANPHNPTQEWNSNDSTKVDFWNFLTGASGENGSTPYVGQNGNWFIGGQDSGIPARGKDGRNGQRAEPVLPIVGQNGNWYINGVDTGVRAKGDNGKDGVVPEITIGNNGNWFIEGVDTGKPARGKDGKAPEVIIGNNGNWFINGRDTNVPAYGKDGKNGKDGKSAYELWKEEVDAGCAGTGPKVKHPHDPKKDWPCNMTSQTNFWQYLSGKDGTATIIEVIKGKFNVIPQYYNLALGEYVNPADGSVKFQVYDKDGNKAPAGSKVKGMPGVTDQNHVFTTDQDGLIIVPRNLLPNKLSDAERRGETAEVTIGSVTETSAKNTFVPNRINTRIKVAKAVLESEGGRVLPSKFHLIRTSYIYEREVDGVWSRYPHTTLLEPRVTLALVKDINQPLSGTNLESSDAIRTKWMRVDKEVPGESAAIIRPTVLRELEKTSPKTDTQIKEYQWNEKDNYFVLKGMTNFYGETPVSSDAVLMAEIYPYPSLAPNIKYFVEEGITYIWGEVLMSALQPYYENNFTLSNNRWTTPKKQAADLPADFKMTISAISPSGATTIDARTTTTKGKKKFRLVGIYENAKVYISEGGTYNGQPSSWYYRCIYYYDFKKENNKFYLIDPLDASIKQEVVKEAMPSNYLN